MDLNALMKQAKQMQDDLKKTQAALEEKIYEGTSNGIVIKIKVNLDEASDRFNGKYLVAGVTHRYTADNKGTEGGYSCFLRLARDAEKGS